MKPDLKTSKDFSPEEQIAALKAIGFSEDDIRKVTIPSKHNILNWIIVKSPLLILVISLFALVLAGISLFLQNSQLERIDALRDRIAIVETSLTANVMNVMNDELPTQTFTPSPSVSTLTPTSPLFTPSYTPTITATNTPTMSLLFGIVNATGVRVRSIPVTGDTIGSLQNKVAVQIIEINEERTWYLIWDPANKISGWVSADFIDPDGKWSPEDVPLTPLPTITPSPTVTPSPTDT